MKTTMPALQPINLEDFAYELPEERIAQFPMPQRDEARLQVYQRGAITHSQFKHLSDFIPPDTLLVFNNTKVIPARLFFHRATGALIEIFLLHPESPSRILSEAMQTTGECIWQCMIGNKKKWKPNETLRHVLQMGESSIELTADLTDSEAGHVRFSWQHQTSSFADIIHHFGEMPLPPYLNRKSTSQDDEQYQTVYSVKEGAVAAPTAGLHFTEQVLTNLKKKRISTDFLTLHVGAGTFQPIKGHDILQHPMHAEQLVFTQQNLEVLLANLPTVYAVGTTSVRALESLYWFGVKLHTAVATDQKIGFHIDKLLPYQFEQSQLPTPAEAIEKVLCYMKSNNWPELIGETQIMIVPGYQFQICKGLVTNYHLPGTTLILLIAAFIGKDWRRVYNEALENNYRFLSYGDSSLLIP